MMRQTVRGWHLQLMNDKELSDLSNMFGPVIRGWANYYGRFHSSALKPLWRQVNDYLVRWRRRKPEHLARDITRTARALGRLRAPRPFVYREWGFCPAAQ
jgi:RNA-directed DNA polymerase